MRSSWQTASLAAGWRFPSDWGVPEVDEVCTSAVLGGDLVDSLTRLGRARACGGADLEETLTDLAALHAVLVGTPESGGLYAPDPDVIPSRFLRVIALAWADATLGELAACEPVDRLTGLATRAYLSVRLGELYRSARAGTDRLDGHLFVVVELDASAVIGLTRPAAMVLAADVLRAVFHRGETVAQLGRSAAVVLAERGPDLTDRVLGLCGQLRRRLAPMSMSMPATVVPVVELEDLPATEPQAQALLNRLARP